MTKADIGNSLIERAFSKISPQPFDWHFQEDGAEVEKPIVAFDVAMECICPT
jgi:hypothetical protein